jgi:hypothetical protein
MSMVSCEIGDLLVSYIHEELDDAEKLRVEKHLAVCPVCSSVLAAMSAVPETLAPPAYLSGDAFVQKVMLNLPARRTSLLGSIISEWLPELSATACILGLALFVFRSETQPTTESLLLGSTAEEYSDIAGDAADVSFDDVLGTKDRGIW